MSGVPDEEELAATRVQSIVRGKSARRQAQEKRDETEKQAAAAVKMQAVARGRRSRHNMQRHWENAAATKVQSTMRGRMARRTLSSARAGGTRATSDGKGGDGNDDDVGNVDDMDRQSVAATRVQSIMRGRATRRGIQKKRAAKEASNAATKVQALFRGRSQRRKLHNKAQEVEPATNERMHMRRANHIMSAAAAYEREIARHVSAVQRRTAKRRIQIARSERTRLNRRHATRKQQKDLVLYSKRRRRVRVVETQTTRLDRVIKISSRDMRRRRGGGGEDTSDSGADKQIYVYMEDRAARVGAAVRSMMAKMKDRGKIDQIKLLKHLQHGIRQASVPQATILDAFLEAFAAIFGFEASVISEECSEIFYALFRTSRSQNILMNHVIRHLGTRVSWEESKLADVEICEDLLNALASCGCLSSAALAESLASPPPSRLSSSPATPAAPSEQDGTSKSDWLPPALRSTLQQFLDQYALNRSAKSPSASDIISMVQKWLTAAFKSERYDDADQQRLHRRLISIVANALPAKNVHGTIAEVFAGAWCGAFLASSEAMLVSDDASGAVEVCSPAISRFRLMFMIIFSKRRDLQRRFLAVLLHAFREVGANESDPGKDPLLAACRSFAALKIIHSQVFTEWSTLGPVFFERAGMPKLAENEQELQRNRLGDFLARLANRQEGGPPSPPAAADLAAPDSELPMLVRDADSTLAWHVPSEVRRMQRHGRKIWGSGQGDRCATPLIDPFSPLSRARLASRDPMPADLLPKQIRIIKPKRPTHRRPTQGRRKRRQAARGRRLREQRS